MVSGSDIKVGLFVLLGLVLTGVVIFLIGDERQFFAASVEMQTEFSDVQGLKRGAPVRMGGVDIGHVASVEYRGEPSDATVHVTLDIVASNAPRIMSDSVAKIVNKGLLGDKMVVISRGTQPPTIPPGGRIPSRDPRDMFGLVDRMATKAENALEGVGSVADSLSDEELHDDLRASVRAFKLLLTQVTEGRGYPHRFLTDPREADRISRAVEGIDRSTAELNATLAEIRGAVRQLRTGPGYAHEVLYGSEPPKAVAQIGAAAEELAISLRSVRESDSFTHDLLYGRPDGAPDPLSDIAQITADLRDIVHGVKMGKGTLGALLVDPSVYEDVKRVLGNVERNKVLRALVRYSIQQDEDGARPEVGTR